jgi:hypothetical protein
VRTVSKLNLPDEEKQAALDEALRQHLDRALTRIVNPNRKHALHPQTVQDLLIEKARRRKPVHPQYGWNLTFMDKSGLRTSLDVIKVPDEHGGRRHANITDVKTVRDQMMKMFDYEWCWLRMRTTQDVWKKA